MKILVVGSGGREHAVCAAIAKSSLCTELFCAPGNAGIGEIATLIDVKAMDIPGMIAAVREFGIDFVAVIPDDPLAAGMVDAMTAAGIRAFGPTAAAAQIEASKAFGKDVMAVAGIPTADYREFGDVGAAMAYAKICPVPIVVKADGLALGKGVLMCYTRQDVIEAVRSCFDGAFGASGQRVVIEEMMSGPEMTVLAFCDGKIAVPMVTSQDYKRSHDGDKGLNTGGMGSVSPALHEQPEDLEWVSANVLQPCIDELARRGTPFAGVLYAGLMRTPQGLKVIEFNARFGDPETQVVLEKLKSDLVEVFVACCDGKLNETQIEWKQNTAILVVAASGGYPSKYQTGYRIDGIMEAEKLGTVVYHAGTKMVDGQVVTAGGRVLGVTAAAADLATARELAYRGLAAIDFRDMHWRGDIGR